MSDNFVLGAGLVYFAPRDNNGNTLAELYMGDSPGLELTIDTQTVEVYTSDDQTAQQAVRSMTQITRNFNLMLRNMDDDNYSRYLLADKATRTGSGATLPTLRVTSAIPGAAYQLGTSTTKNSGARDVTNVTVTIDPDGAATAATVDVDYTVDDALGRVTIVKGGGITDGDVLDIDADEGSTAYTEVVTNGNGAKRGALRYIANNTIGDNRDLYVPDCELIPSGNLPFKSRDTVQEMQFTVAVREIAGFGQVCLATRAA